MQIKEITVSAGRTLPHPIQSYANLRSQVTLRERQAARETADDLPLFGEAATDYEREGDY